MTAAAVELWGTRIAAVSIEPGERYATFRYDPEFTPSGIEVAPLRMPLSDRPYTFPGLPPDSFSGLPGMLADSLPDRWGTALVDAWLAAQRQKFVSELTEDPEEQAIKEILSIGTSAGGARPKAIIAYNESTHVVRSGQIDSGPGFEHWLLKFDGVEKSGDHGLVDPQGWCAIEYAYSLMAVEAGIEMSECRLLEEHGRRHF